MNYDNYLISRCDAMEWLAENYPVFPETMPSVRQRAEGISETLFRGWGFVVLINGELVFADCLSPCIRAADMAEFKLPEIHL